MQNDIPPPLPVPPPPPAPRIWPALTVGAISIPFALLVAGIIQGVALIAIGAIHPTTKSFDLMAGVEKLTDHPWGTVVMLLPGQLCMLAAALGAALLSPHSLVARFGYTRSALPWWTLPLLVGGTFFAGQLGGLLVQSIFDDPGDNLRMLIRLMQKPHGAELAMLAVLLCVVPPFVEETLFRGYIQRRLLQRWHPAAAIAASSVFFTLAHFDPVHVLAVVPLAVWLGIVAWRCGSLWPAMLCHAAQNSFALWGARQGDPLAMEITSFDLIVLSVSATLTLGAIAVMRRHPAPAY